MPLKKKLLTLAIAAPAAMALSISAPVAANASEHKPPCKKKAIKKALNKTNDGEVSMVIDKKCAEKKGQWWAAGDFEMNVDIAYLVYGKQKKNGKWKWVDDQRKTCETDRKAIPKKLRGICDVD